MNDAKRDGGRPIILNELLLTICRPKGGRRCSVEVSNAEPRDRRFIRALAELVAAWFDRV